MKLSAILVLFLLGLNIQSSAQNCNCPDELLYVKSKIETNYAGFKDKVTPSSRAAYEKHNKAFLAQSKEITKPEYCLYLINNWLKFFKDRHIQINRNRLSSEIEKIQLQKRLNGIENILLSDKQLTILKADHTVQGIYWSPDSVYQIAVISNKNSFRDFAGVILQSKSPAWKKNQVILELKLNKKRDTLTGLAYNNFHIPEAVVFPLTRNSIDNWQKEGTQRKKTEKIMQEEVAGKVLSAKTFYIKISSFNERNAALIDSLFKSNAAVLQTMPNLILDIRNNGGGADFTYQPIIPYLYTDTIRNIGADVLATEDNINGWAALLKLNSIPQTEKTAIANTVEQMKLHKDHLISLSKTSTTAFSDVMLFPKKIVILINGKCGSTTEEFLLAAVQSSKVTVMGEHTAGVLDYSNIRGADFKSLPYMLYWATSRSRRLDLGKGIDNIGIKPNIHLNPDQNWVNAAQEYLEK